MNSYAVRVRGRNGLVIVRCGNNVGSCGVNVWGSWYGKNGEGAVEIGTRGGGG